MFNRFLARTVMASLLAVVGLGCDPGSVSAPTQPTTATQPPTPTAPVGPSISAVSPNIGSTDGGTPVTITGTGIHAGATITLGGVVVYGTFGWHPRDRNITMMHFSAPARTAGPVDVVVSHPGGAFARLPDGYTYAPRQSFDFNGEWFGSSGEALVFRFTIQNNLLISVTCQYSGTETTTFSPSPSVDNGEFSLSGDNGVVIAGTIVSTSVAVGTINIPSCGPATTWDAGKLTQ